MRLLSVVALLFCAWLFAPNSGRANDCGASSGVPLDPEAETLMASLDADFRRGPRIARIDIRTEYTRRRHFGQSPAIPPSERTLWGVFDGDLEQTRLLYVFSGPGRLAGTTLLMHDRAGSTAEDAMWLYLRSFEIFQRMEPEKEQVMVPGTALTYEDSRGFIPVDKYRFSFDAPTTSPGAPDEVRLLGCPRTASIREDLGYRSLRLRVDPVKRLVRSVEYADLNGRPLKSYTLLRDLGVGARWFPGEVRLQHHAEGFITLLGYEYWLPESPPPRSLFEPSVEKSRFIDRLTAYLTQVGLGERIRAELARADEQYREFLERLRRIQEAENSGRPYRP